MAINADIQNTLSLIPDPNNIAPKFMAWVQAQAQPFVDTQAAAASMLDAFNIDTAVGDQLDVLGKILGVSRTVSFQPSDGSSPVLSDDNYRLILKAKIIQNQWDGSKGQLYDFFSQAFPTVPIIIQDNQDMTMDVLVIGMAPGVQQDLVTHGYFVPVPSGVGVNYTFSTTPIFAWDTNTTYLKGWDQGYWASFN